MYQKRATYGPAQIRPVKWPDEGASDRVDQCAQIQTSQMYSSEYTLPLHRNHATKLNSGDDRLNLGLKPYFARIVQNSSLRS